MQAKKFLQLLPILFSILFITSCTEDNLDPQENFENIVSYEFLETITADDVKARFGNNPLISDIANFDVDAYKVIYSTPNFDGTMVEASGLVLIPEVPGSVKLTSFQHSTLRKDENPANDQENRAPSYLSSESAEIYLSAVLYASNGYLISAADYIGYGSTKDMFHPYEHAKTAATTSFDMLEASKELAELLEISLTDDLFLLGYSQGGNSTMALHKYIEENHLTQYPITRSAMGAGAYHKTAFGDYIFSFEGEIGLSLNLYLWVLDSYDRIYLQRGMSYYLNEPYATEVRENGYYNISNTDPDLVFTEEFLGEFTNADSDFRAALADNDIHDWRAEAPIKLFHSRDDNLVPYFNSVDAFENMTANGSTEILFETYTFGADVEPGEIHGRGGAEFFTDVISLYFRFGL